MPVPNQTVTPGVVPLRDTGLGGQPADSWWRKSVRRLRGLQTDHGHTPVQRRAAVRSRGRAPRWLLGAAVPRAG